MPNLKNRKAPKTQVTNRTWGTLRISLLRENIQKWYPPLVLPCQHPLRTRLPATRQSSEAKSMDWDRYFQLTGLLDSGHVEEAIRELTSLGKATEDHIGKAFVLMGVANGLRDLGRLSDARCKVQEACELFGRQNEYYPRAAFLSAVLDMDERDWKGALKKLDEILKEHGAVLQMEEHKDILERVQKYRAMTLVGLGQFTEARPIFEHYRSEPIEREMNLYYLGECEFELGDFTSSQRDLEEVLGLDLALPYRAYAHEYLGRIYFNQKQIARAKSEFEKCLNYPDRDKSRDETLMKWLISSSKELNQTEDAARYSEMLKKLHSGGRPGR